MRPLAERGEDTPPSPAQGFCDGNGDRGRRQCDQSLGNGNDARIAARPLAQRSVFAYLGDRGKMVLQNAKNPLSGENRRSPGRCPGAQSAHSPRVVDARTPFPGRGPPRWWVSVCPPGGPLDVLAGAPVWDRNIKWGHHLKRPRFNAKKFPAGRSVFRPFLKRLPPVPRARVRPKPHRGNGVPPSDA
ncbi:MAG: hypothetical protein CM15mP87_01530 [Candidatus Neomarinimicrobiota bacterium]|nr:MAG: hypothetical protein CM15mP87_01530 [Candidatus Neomarinimicrobiota bacterium]